MKKPCLIILSGMPLTGKTYTAKKIQNKFFPTQHRDVDQYRQFFEKKKSKNLSSNYEEKIMVKCYKQLCKDALDFLEHNDSIIISGTFSKDCFKKSLKKLIKKIDKKYQNECCRLYN